MVPVGAGEIVNAGISDTYGLLPGQLEVTKTIAGPLRGQQDVVVIHTVCTPAANTPDFPIAAGATGVQSTVYSGIAAGASCVVSETANGQTSAATVAVKGSPQTATIPAGGAAVASITDSYGAAPGSLLVTKTIAGPLAGHQRAGHDPRRLQRSRRVGGLRDPRWDPGTHRVAQFRRHPSRLRVHRHRDQGRCHQHGQCNCVGRWPEGDRPGGQSGASEPERRVPGHARLPEGDQEDRWTGCSLTRSHRHFGGLWRSALRFRVPPPRSDPCRFCLAIVCWRSGPIPLHRDRGRSRPHW